MSNNFSLSVKRKGDELESFIMKIRRTETSWLILDNGDSGTVPVGPVPASLPPVAASLPPVPAPLVPALASQTPAPETGDLPPLVLRKSGSSNWTFLLKVIMTFII